MCKRQSHLGMCGSSRCRGRLCWHSCCSWNGSRCIWGVCLGIKNKTKLSLVFQNFDAWTSTHLWGPDNTHDNTFIRNCIFFSQIHPSSTKFLTFHFQNEIIGINPCFDRYRLSQIDSHLQLLRRKIQAGYHPPVPPTLFLRWFPGLYYKPSCIAGQWMNGH